MSVSIQLTSMLAAEYSGSSRLDVAAGTVREALDQLQQHPKLYRCICDETDAVRRHLNLFINDELLDRGAGLDAPLQPGDQLFIMTAVSGG